MGSSSPGKGGWPEGKRQELREEVRFETAAAV